MTFRKLLEKNEAKSRQRSGSFPCRYNTESGCLPFVGTVEAGFWEVSPQLAIVSPKSRLATVARSVTGLTMNTVGPQARSSLLAVVFRTATRPESQARGVEGTRCTDLAAGGDDPRADRFGSGTSDRRHFRSRRRSPSRRVTPSRS